MSGCGGAPPTVDLLASTQGAVRGAEEAGAQDDPQAALHLKLAKEQVAAAKVLMDDGDDEEAHLKLLRAEADAELAHALAEKAATVSKAAEAMEDLDKLKKQGK
ncbi:MAG: DUF4398 domain-containing protein [Deltaproteobacteria bacterium]|nr:DUF4398 domain-containing protein [Deltaproteobacteria bacterium]MBW2531629.1 DUF4398 domain-containing protein [Deltaproteobacteria bacterium]